MKLRACVPLPVPGTVAHDVHAVPLNLVYRIEPALSPLMQNSHRLVPLLAPNRPAPFLNDWPGPNAGGAGAIAVHALEAGTYCAPSTPVPDALRRNA